MKPRVVNGILAVRDRDRGDGGGHRRTPGTARGAAPGIRPRIM
ncbi:hypothetical protein [Streptomyces wuyuanensis]